MNNSSIFTSVNNITESGRNERIVPVLGNCIDKLLEKNVAVFGLGGVGGYVLEAMCRTGIGNFHIIDKDVVAPSNLNRQLIATENTIGQRKTELWKARILSINSNIKVHTYDMFYLPGMETELPWESFDYVIDAVDTVTAKIAIIEKAYALNIPVISSMGTGNKLGCAAPEITTIEKTSVCPLAKVMRKELKNRGIKNVKVVFSREEPACSNRTPGSLAWVPGMAGLMIAGEAIRDLVNS